MTPKAKRYAAWKRVNAPKVKAHDQRPKLPMLHRWDGTPVRVGDLAYTIRGTVVTVAATHPPTHPASRGAIDVYYKYDDIQYLKRGLFPQVIAASFWTPEQAILPAEFWETPYAIKHAHLARFKAHYDAQPVSLTDSEEPEGVDFDAPEFTEWMDEL